MATVDRGLQQQSRESRRKDWQTQGSDIHHSSSQGKTYRKVKEAERIHRATSDGPKYTSQRPKKEKIEKLLILYL